MTKLLGITKSAPDDWTQSQLAVIFSIAIFFLGTSAAVFGKWVEEQGPRLSLIHIYLPTRAAPMRLRLMP